MNMNDFDKRRAYYNAEIIKLLKEYLDGKGSQLRFCQLISILNQDEDYFYEEPEQTVARFKEQLQTSRNETSYEYK